MPPVVDTSPVGVPPPAGLLPLGATMRDRRSPARVRSVYDRLPRRPPRSRSAPGYRAHV
jgi:hypothetical protein